MITYRSLLEQFPKTRKNGAALGAIPMDYFNAHEDEIRAVMRGEGYPRTMYRGPRYGRGFARPTMTRRRDATSVLFYYGL